MGITQTARKIPWRMLLRWYSIIRSVLFVYRRVETDCFVLNMGVKEAETLFGKRFFTKDWEFSYSYRGEDLNMRRPLYKEDEWKWYQLHIRGFLTEGGEKIEIQGHTELEPFDHPRAHFNNVNLSRGEGFSMIKDILDDAGVEYEVKRI